ncbi:uncharacterized protein [Primulina eburnea]|uniref:uncharacterized protein n=1 Tax=Primulina eburnea TaxID=1245227 RepID=UPI003C6C6856
MAPYEPLYERKCSSLVYWDDVGERAELGPNIVRQTSDLVARIWDKMKTAQSCQKSYAYQRRRDLDFAVWDHVFMKVAPMKGVMRFGKKILRTIEDPREIWDTCVQSRFTGVHNVFHASMLWKYMSNPSHVLNYEPLHLTPHLSFEEKPTQILDMQEKRLRKSVMAAVYVIRELLSLE